MKNYLRSILYSMIFIFSIVFAFALPIDNLKYYYSFDSLENLSAYNRTVIDELGHSNFTYNNPSYDIVYVALDTNGKKGNSLYTGNLENSYGNMKNFNMSLLNGKNITINYWFKINTSNIDFYNFLPYLTTYYNSTKALNQYYRVFDKSYQSIYGDNISKTFSYQTKSYSIPINNTWYMLTLIYYQNDNIVTFANAGYWLSNNTNSIILGNEGIYSLNSDYSNFDELSVWDIALNQNDVINLWNSGNGLNFIETYYNQNPSNYTYDGFYHNYCWYNILCQNYNVSEDLCDDSPRKVCNQECADTFDSYLLAGLENETASFSGLCINNSYYYQYPTYEGLNSDIIYDVCVGHYLCHQYNITANISCPIYINASSGILNKIDCVHETNSIVAECFDTFDIYDNLGTYPPYNNYSGMCSECRSDCSYENSTSCYNSNTIQKCEKYKSCLKEFTISSCKVGDRCYLGMCILNETVITITEVSDFGNFFNNLSLNSKYWITLLSTIFILIIMVILLSFSGNGIAGLMVGLVMSMIINLTLTIIFNLSLLIPILYIIIGGAIFALLIRKIFVG